MFETVITILGLTAAAVYVAYLAYAIHAVPLWIIVIATFVLAIREFLVELRGEQSGKNG
ncbi:MAG: hypothetical protein ACM338_12725 [Betaproteobacteria bacterium]